MKTISLKKIATSAAAVLFAATTFAQVIGGNQQELFDLYVMGNYEKCYDKAIKMTEKDKTKFDSEGYLYAALCMLRIHQDPELREVEEYEDAVKDAVKLAAKFKKRDDRHIKKEEPHLFDDNKEIIYELKELAIEEAKGYFAQEDYRKAAYYMRYGLRIDEDDPSMEIFKGASDILSRNKRVGLEHTENAVKSFEKQASSGDAKPHERVYYAFEKGFVEYVKYLKENDEVEKAREVIAVARKVDPENKKFERTANSL